MRDREEEEAGKKGRRSPFCSGTVSVCLSAFFFVVGASDSVSSLFSLTNCGRETEMVSLSCCPEPRQGSRGEQGKVCGVSHSPLCTSQAS